MTETTAHELAWHEVMDRLGAGLTRAATAAFPGVIFEAELNRDAFRADRLLHDPAEPPLLLLWQDGPTPERLLAAVPTRLETSLSAGDEKASLAIPLVLPLRHLTNPARTAVALRLLAAGVDDLPTGAVYDLVTEPSPRPGLWDRADLAERTQWRLSRLLARAQELAERTDFTTEPVTHAEAARAALLEAMLGGRGLDWPVNDDVLVLWLAGPTGATLEEVLAQQGQA